MRETAALDRLIAKVTIGANGEDERHSSFRAALEAVTELPCGGIVIGEPVSVIAWDFDGNERRGVTATCRKEDGSEHVVAAWEVALPETARGAEFLAAYRRWLGSEPNQGSARSSTTKKPRNEIESAKIDLGGPIDLVIDAVKERAAQCRVLGSERRIILRAGTIERIAPGEIARVDPEKLWTYARHEYLSGEIAETRIDAHALGLVPLKLKDEGLWDPEDTEEDSDDPPANASGRRPVFEMEQVLPGADPEADTDPIIESNELKATGDIAGARKILMDLCRADLRCLDAHAHLGILAFANWPEYAIRHYEVGVRIGELSFGEGFDGILPWYLIDNRPFLRCMHGYGLCLWRLKRFEEADLVFSRMLRLNPNDNQGVRFLVERVNAKQTWREDLY